MNNRNRRNNRNYYNETRDAHRKKKGKTFASQEINIKELVFAPEGYEAIFFFGYFLIIPYFVGALFLFLFIAGGDFSSFMLLNISSIFIVWAIGYEIVASITLFIIFLMFMRYDDKY